MKTPRGTTETHANKMKTVWHPTVDGRRRRRRMRKWEKCQSGTAGKTHSEGPWVLHLLFVILKFELVFLSSLFIVVAFDQLLPSGRQNTGEQREREKQKKIYFSWLWKSNSRLDFNFVCVCLSFFSGDCHCGVWRCQLRFRWLPTFDLPSMATAAAICVYM